MHAVAIPVTDLRREPELLDTVPPRDLLQESQLLYGERVKVLEERDGWSRVTAEEQPKGATGYPGWVQSDHLVAAPAADPSNLVVKVLWANVGNLQLSFGTRLHGLERAADRWRVRLVSGQEIWLPASEVQRCQKSSYWRDVMPQFGSQFIGSKYFWGGRSAPRPGLAGYGVDCSGLVHLLYGIFGIGLPRDASDQRIAAQPIGPTELRQCDLVFLHPEPDSRPDHVMIYVGKEELLESTFSFGVVRQVSFRDKVGISLAEMQADPRNVSATVSFGRASS